jgi:DNA-binding ferritin-like protein
MDIQQRVQILIGGDATQAKKVIKEVENEMRASQTRQKASAKNVGTEAGDSYGRAFNRAQDRWLKTAEDGFRRYGGRVGGILANIIGTYDRFDKSIQASRQVQSIGREAGSKGIGVTEIALGTVAGRGVVRGAKEGVKAVTKPTMANISNEFAALRAYRKSRGRLDDFAIDLSELQVKEGQKVEKIEVNQKGILGRLGKYVSAWAGTTIGKIAIVAASAAAAISVAGFALSKVFADRKITRGMELVVANFEQLKKTLDEIQDPAERSRFLINNLGEQGATKFNQLAEEAANVKKELGDLTYWRGATNGIVTLFEGISEKIKELLDIRPSDSIMKVLWRGTKESFGKYSPLGMAGNLINQVTTGGDTEGAANAEAEGIASDAKLAKINANANRLKTLRENADKSSKEIARSELDPKERVNSLSKEIQLLKEKNSTVKDVDEHFRNQVKLLELTLEKQKAIRDVAKEEADTRKGMFEDMQKAYEASQKRAEDDNNKQRSIEDQSRLSISDLSSMGGASGNAAKNVQSLEEQAKAARAQGNHALADKLIGQANVIRGDLGAKGITDSNEFGDNFPVAQAEPDLRGTMMDTSRGELGVATGMNNDSAQAFWKTQRESAQIAKELGLVKISDRALKGRPDLQKLKQRGLERLKEIESGRKSKEKLTMEEFFAANQYVPVKPKNGK